MTVHRGSMLLALIRAGLLSVPVPRRRRAEPSRTPRRRTIPSTQHPRPIGVTSVLQQLENATAANQNHVDITMTATTAGSLLMVGLSSTNSHHVTGVADGGDTFVQATGAEAVNAGQGFVTDIWYCLSGSGGKTALVGTYDAGSTSTKEMWVMEISYTGTATFDVAGKLDNGTGVSNVDTGPTVTTTGTTGFILAIIQTQGGVTAIASGNEFTIGNITANSDGSAYLISSSATTHTPAWAESSGSGPGICVSVAAVKFSGGGGGGGTSWGPQLSDQLNRIVQYAA